MADFPAIIATERPISQGRWGIRSGKTLDGGIVTTRTQSTPIGKPLRLQFENITQADFLLILAHYRGQRSGFDPFRFTTTTLPAESTPSGHCWAYASPPRIVDRYNDVFTVEADFLSQLQRAVRVPGAHLFVSSSLAAGGATVGVTAAGAQLVAEVSLTAPGAIIPEAGGINLTATASLVDSGAAVIGSAGSTSGGMISYSGGTTGDWDTENILAYGFRFSLSSAKTISAVGVADPTGSGVPDEYAIAIVNGTNIGTGISYVTLDAAGSQNVYAFTTGTSLALEGGWRKASISGGRTIPAGTYTLVLWWSATPGQLARNASGVTTQSGVTYVENIRWDYDEVAATTPADGVAYFGPMLFFT